MAPKGYDVRVVLDEDVPEVLAEGLRTRGARVATVNELRERIEARRGGDLAGEPISDEEVCREVASEPSVLVSLNLRDYADLASMQKLAIEHGVTVVIVRPPKAEAGARQRPTAIADIVHRHLPRIVSMYGDEPLVGSANRRSLRVRPALEILRAAAPGRVDATPRVDKPPRRRRPRRARRKPEPPGAGTLNIDGP